MSSFRIILGGRGVDVPIVHRDLKDAKCNCEMIKSPIGFHSVFTFNCFNQPKNYVIDKIYELYFISKYFSNNDYAVNDQHVQFNKIDMFLKVKLNPDFDTRLLINNSSTTIMYLSHDDKVVRFLSNFLITFEMEEIKFL